MSTRPCTSHFWPGHGNLEVSQADLTLPPGGIQARSERFRHDNRAECMLGLQRYDQGQVSVLGLKPTDLCTAQQSDGGIRFIES